MWYFRFIVHRRGGQMNQDNPVQIEEMEVLKKEMCDRSRKKKEEVEKKMERKSKSSPRK